MNLKINDKIQSNITDSIYTVIEIKNNYDYVCLDQNGHQITFFIDDESTQFKLLERKKEKQNATSSDILR